MVPFRDQPQFYIYTKVNEMWYASRYYGVELGYWTGTAFASRGVVEMNTDFSSESDEVVVSDAIAGPWFRSTKRWNGGTSQLGVGNTVSSGTWWQILYIHYKLSMYPPPFVVTV